MEDRDVRGRGITREQSETQRTVKGTATKESQVINEMESGKKGYKLTHCEDDGEEGE